MGTTFQADIPGNIHPVTYDYASVASGGGASRFSIFVAPQDIRIKKFHISPYGGDQGANTASYRRLSIVDGGPNGTGTAVIASHNFSASQASMGTVSGAIATANQDLDEGDVLIFSQTTVGGAHTTGTVLQAGRVFVEYELR